MTKFEKLFGGVAVILAMIASVLAILNLEAAAIAVIPGVLVAVIFLVAQVLRESRREKRSLELLAESVRMTRDVAKDAKREVSDTRGELLENHLQLANSIVEGVNREGMDIRSVIQKEAQQSRQALQDAEDSLTAHADSSSQQLRTRIVTERKNVVAEVQATEGRIASALVDGADAVGGAQHVFTQKLIARQDGLHEVVDEIEALLARGEGDLKELSEKLDALAGADGLEALGLGVDDLGRRVRKLDESVELLSEQGGDTRSASMSLLDDLAAAQAKLDGLQAAVGRMNDQADADRAAVERVGREVQAVEQGFREGVRDLADRQAKESNGLTFAMRNEIQQIEALLARGEGDLKELSEKLDALAGADGLEALGLGVDDLGRRVRKLDESVELLSEQDGDTRSASISVLGELAAAQAKLDGLQAAIGRMNDQADADRAAVDRVGLGVQAVEQVFQEGVEDLAERQAKESNRLTVAMRNETQQIEALLHLMDGIEPRWIMPSLGRWALDARAALHLRTIIEDRNPARVLEVGGGSSTILLGYLCERIGAQVVSVDHHPTFVERTQLMVQRHGLEETVDVRLGELEAYEIGGQDYQWYARSAFEGLQDVDLLFVDGPPSTTGSMARFPAVPELHDRLSGGAAVVLDDSERPDERATIESWLSKYPEFRRSQEGISRLAYFERGKP